MDEKQFEQDYRNWKRQAAPGSVGRELKEG